jgi:serine/threonine protein kinase/tetratricopeptide (TPR) repeat protein
MAGVAGHAGTLTDPLFFPTQTSDACMSADPSPVVYGKYQLLELLARGGMAEVFKAKSYGVEGFEKVLVIKRILPELGENPQFVEMFIAEAKIAVTLSHANIVQVFDLGRADESYFIAMEYVAGYDFATVLRRGRQLRRPVSQELAVFVVSELAKGLDYAHRRRDSNLRPLSIVHRDVSPQNVLLSFEGEVKLTDFGIAKARTIVKDETEVGVLKGKYAYMSPEQARAEAVDSRTDLYALGVVLYEALAGVNPFEAGSSYETIRRVRDGQAPMLKSVARDVPDELAAIVDRALSRSPEDRHPNAGRLYEELVQFLYSSGRRVGGHDLSRYLLELRQASEAASSDQEGDRLIAVFEGDGDASRNRTPVEVPFRHSRPPSARPPKHATGVSRPTAERREVTSVVVRTSSPGLLLDPQIDRVLRRFGGARLGTADLGNGFTEATLVFGLRDPDGRDTESAARCSLRLVRAAASGTQVGREVAIQIGLHTGRILVDMSGEAIRDEAFEGLRRAARDLAARAQNGQVLLSPEAQHAVVSLFGTLPTGEPQAPYSLEGELAQGEAGKFVGRREELKQMGELLALANRGRMRVVALVGEAGTGKTRVMLETRRRLRLGGHDVGTYIATCARRARSVPLSAIQEMLRTIVGIDEFDPEDAIRDKVARLRELGLQPQELGALAAALGAAPFPEATESLGRLLRPAIARMTVKLAADRLTVLCFDGAESMDEESGAIVDGLIRDVREARVAVVLAYRPGFAHAWGELPNYHEMALGPMSDDDVARLAATRLAAEEVPLDLLREITTKSAGNPLYVEEYVKALTDAGAVEVSEGRVTYRPEVAEVEVPKNLRGIVSARLARLTVNDRHLVQIASVAGTRFSPELLADVSGEPVRDVTEALAVLEGRGVVTRLASGDFAFAHDLVGDVLRDGLTIESRREMHGAVAVALERLYPQRLDEMAERLADHFRQAGERSKAVDYLVRAAERLAAEQSYTPALASLDRAVEILSQMHTVDRDRLLALFQRLGELLWTARQLDQGLSRMDPALELAEACGREDYVARFSMMRGRFLVQADRVDEGRHWLARAIEIAQRLTDRALTLDVTLARAEADLRLGEHRSAIQFFGQALQLAREMGNVPVRLRALVNLALTHATAGQFEEGLARVEEARRILSQHPDRYTECEVEKMEALVHFFAMDYAQAIEAASRGLELAKEYGFFYEQAVNAHNIGEGYVRLGDYKRAFASLRYSYDIARDHGIEHLQMANMRVLGFIDAMRFGSDDGRKHVVDAIQHAEARRHVWELVQGRYLLAMIDQQRGAVEDARAGLREALRLASEHGYDAYARSAESGLRALEDGKAIPLLA